jgi:hypothetical protein
MTTANPKMFKDSERALEWARTYGRDHCYPHHFWRVERADNAADTFVIAVRSRNSGALHHYATEE